MGNTPPPSVKKSPKELSRDMNRAIDRNIREFARDRFRLQSDLNKSKRELENSIKKNEPKASQRILAQNIVKNQASLAKYDLLEAKMKAMKMQVTQVTSGEAMVTVMKNMGQLMGKTTDGLNVNNIQNAIETFNLRMEEHENMTEMVDDVMANDNNDVEENEVDDFIDMVSDQIGGKGKGGSKVSESQMQQSGNFDDMLNDLKK